MSFIYQEEPIITIGHARKSDQRSPVAIHRVQAFDHDPGMSLAARVTPLSDDTFKGIEVIVWHSDCGAPPRVDSRMCARMNQLVIDNQIVALWQSGEDCHFRGIPTAEIQHPFGMEECGCFLFERLMLGMIAAKEPRAACTN